MKSLRRLALRLPLAAALVATGVAYTASTGLGEAKVSFQELEESLTCQCGCGLTVHSCNHLQCPSALPLREEIREQMGLGKGKEAILAHFAEKYGEKILSSPTTAGFNILAWITPFILVGLGGLVVGITLMRWNRRHRTAPSTALRATAKSAPSPHRDILEKELEKFDG